MINWTTRARYAASLMLCVSMLGCTTMQVDTAPSDRFADKRYQSFSWRAEYPQGCLNPWNPFTASPLP